MRKRVTFHFYQKEFTFPTKAEPLWKNEVDRWYQLDAYSYGMADFYSESGLEKRAKPEILILASPGASNETDSSFALGGAISPGKFVHTLPNVRASSLCQVMKWNGPVLCLQNDPETQVSALIEAAFLSLHEKKTVWVMSVRGSAPAYIAEAYVFESKPNLEAIAESRIQYQISIEPKKDQSPKINLKKDTELWQWLSHASPENVHFYLNDSCILERIF